MQRLMFTLVLSAIACGAINAEDKTPVITESSYLTKALQHTTALERFSSLATTKAKDADVKEFATKLHDRAKECRVKFEEIGKESKVGLVVGLEKKRQAALADLATRSGDDFDRAYLAQVISDLEQVRTDMKGHDKFSDTKLKDAGSGTCKHCEECLEKAKKLQTRIGKPETDRKSDR